MCHLNLVISFFFYPLILLSSLHSNIMTPFPLSSTFLNPIYSWRLSILLAITPFLSILTTFLNPSYLEMSWLPCQVLISTVSSISFPVNHFLHSSLFFTFVKLYFCVLFIQYILGSFPLRLNFLLILSLFLLSQFHDPSMFFFFTCIKLYFLYFSFNAR